MNTLGDTSRAGDTSKADEAAETAEAGRVRDDRPTVLTIAGSDSGGGAGIQADLKTLLALGAHGASVVTAVTAQNSVGVQGVWELPPKAVIAQFSSVVHDIGVQAVKTGMLASPLIVDTVVELLTELPDAPLVVDPVLAATSGDALLTDGSVDELRRGLLPLATVVTPNLREAERLAEMPVRDEDGMRDAAELIHDQGPAWVLIKGGHLEGDWAADLLYDGSEEHWFRAPRVPSPHTHGTGCTLATAIAAYLAFGRDVPDAVSAAKTYITGAIAAGYPRGAGAGPVDHAWSLR